MYLWPWVGCTGSSLISNRWAFIIRPAVCVYNKTAPVGVGRLQLLGWLCWLAWLSFSVRFSRDGSRAALTNDEDC